MPARVFFRDGFVEFLRLAVEAARIGDRTRVARQIRFDHRDIGGDLVLRKVFFGARCPRKERDEQDWRHSIQD